MGDHISKVNKKSYGYIGLLVFLCLVIFTPYFNIGGRDNFEITFVVTLAFIVLIPAAFKKFRNSDSKIINGFLIIMFAVLVMDTLSILNYVRVSHGFENIISNIVPNAKIALYILVIIGLYGIRMEKFEFKSFIRNVIPVLAIVLSVIGIFQRYDFLGFNSWFTPLYISSDSGRILIEGLKGQQDWSRIMGTLSNPNFYSAQLLILLAFVTSNIIYDNEKKSRIINSAAAVLLFITLVFTQSRTALIVLFCVGLYVILLQIIKGGKKYVLRYLAVLVGMAALVFLFIKVLDLGYLFEAIKYGKGITSITERFTRWKDAINLFKLHPIIGIGPVIGKYFASVDNEYVHILRNYGALGLIAHLSFYLYVFIKSIKDIFSHKDVLAKQYAFAVNISIAAILVSNITLATFYHWRNFVLLIFVCAMWARTRDAKLCLAGSKSEDVNNG